MTTLVFAKATVYLHARRSGALLTRSDTPKHPIVLAHGLLGFDELRLAGELLPGIEYWRGIREALSLNGVEVITASVVPSGSIEKRAEMLSRNIKEKAKGRSVNIVAYGSRSESE